MTTPTEGLIQWLFVIGVWRFHELLKRRSSERCNGIRCLHGIFPQPGLHPSDCGDLSRVADHEKVHVDDQPLNARSNTYAELSRGKGSSARGWNGVLMPFNAAFFPRLKENLSSIEHALALCIRN